MIIRPSTLHWLSCILRCLREAQTLTSKFLLPAVTFFWALIQLPLQFHASISHWFLSPGDQHLQVSIDSTILSIPFPPFLVFSERCWKYEHGNIHAAHGWISWRTEEILFVVLSQWWCFWAWCTFPTFTFKTFNQRRFLKILLCSVSLYAISFMSSFTWFKVLPASICGWLCLLCLMKVWSVRSSSRSSCCPVLSLISLTRLKEKLYMMYSWYSFFSSFSVGISSKDC